MVKLERGKIGEIKEKFEKLYLNIWLYQLARILPSNYNFTRVGC